MLSSIRRYPLKDITLGVLAAPAAVCIALKVCHTVARIWRARHVNLAGQVVVITGAAGGFGTAVVARLLKLGAVVYAVDVVPVEKIQAALGDHANLTCISADITDTPAVQRIVDTVTAKHKQVYGLINNAGITGKFHATVEGDSSNLRKVMEINFFAGTELTLSLIHI